MSRRGNAAGLQLPPRQAPWRRPHAPLLPAALPCSYGLDLFLLSIDEGISGYRDDSLETVKRNEAQYQARAKLSQEAGGSGGAGGARGGRRMCLPTLVAAFNPRPPLLLPPQLPRRSRCTFFRTRTCTDGPWTKSWRRWAPRATAPFAACSDGRCAAPMNKRVAERAAAAAVVAAAGRLALPGCAHPRKCRCPCAPQPAPCRRWTAALHWCRRTRLPRGTTPTTWQRRCCSTSYEGMCRGEGGGRC